MHISNHEVPAVRTDQTYKFFIRGKSITHATVTIHAKDLDIARNWLHILFPGSDLSDIEVQHAGKP